MENVKNYIKKRPEIIKYLLMIVFFLLPFVPHGVQIIKISFEVLVQLIFAFAAYMSCKHLFKIKSNYVIALFVFIALIAGKIMLPAYSLTLEGGVKKIETAQQAKQEVFLKPIWVIDPHPYRMYAAKAPDGYRQDYSDGNYSIASGNKMLTYNKYNKLVYIAISDKNIMNFPRKLSRYEYPSGKLVELTYGKTPNDGYIFRSDGSLKGMWEHGIYYEGEKQLGSLTTTYAN